MRKHDNELIQPIERRATRRLGGLRDSRECEIGQYFHWLGLTRFR
jgi:hypothetical protein